MRRLYIGLGFFIGALAIISTVSYYRLLPAPTTVAPTPKPSIITILATVRHQLTTSSSPLVAATPITTSNFTGYPVPSQPFSVILPATTSNSLTVEATTQQTATAQTYISYVPAISRTFIAAGYHQTTSQTNTFLTAVYYFVRLPNVCQLSIYSQLTLTCSSQVLSIADEAAPLVAAYRTQAVVSDPLSISAPTINVSQTAGYSIATLPVFNGSNETDVHFYKNTGAWQMINLGWYNDPHEDGDIEPNCIDFDSDIAIRLAYTGVACYDSADNKTATIN
jgi:hypothetical protein